MTLQFLLVFPNMFGFKGGIQVYSAFLLQALQQLYPESQYQVLLKYDREIPPSHSFLPQTQFCCFGPFPRWMQSLLLALTLVKLSIQKRPQLMICTHVNYSVVFQWIKRLFGIPYWVVAHGTEVWDISEPRLQKALYHADRVVAVSQYTRSRLLLEQKLTPAQVVILPNTFDDRRFQIKLKPQYLLERYKLSLEQPIILTVSRLGRSARYKGYGILLDALVLLRQNIPNIHYILVGKGDDRPWIEAKIETLNLSSSVTLTGLIPDEELCDHYNLCDVFALPSQGEGFGIVYLEAMACGKPVLGGNQDGAIDPLAGGEWGSLVDPENVNEIANTLDQILQKKHPNPRFYEPEALRNYVIQTYSPDQFRHQLNSLLSLQGL
jgi:glycosyltransferase involved in cell wall biosynthesis